MVEAYLRRSPLSHRGLPARARADAGRKASAGLLLAERPHRAQINLRGEADAAFLDAVRGALGLTPPTTPNTTAKAGELKALWLGPNEWLIVGPDARRGEIADQLRAALAGQHTAVTDVSEARTAIAVSGPRARELMAKGTGLDLHPRAFKAGQCAQTAMAQANMTLDQTDDMPSYDLYILDSFADYLWSWIELAGADLDIAVVE